MISSAWIFVIIFGVGLVIGILFWHFKVQDGFRPQSMVIPDYKGICLFDIDGTLSTGTQNENVVQYCLDNGYAVGIATAGAVYRPGNLLSYSWMPKNLYNFMAQNNFDTFHNVASGILSGIHNAAEYTKIKKSMPSDAFWAGWFKAFALERTAKLYGIEFHNNVILFDNDPSFINGVLRYNNIHNRNFRVVCAGQPCRDNTLTLNDVVHALE